jgi:hypothetical protein
MAVGQTLCLTPGTRVGREARPTSSRPAPSCLTLVLFLFLVVSVSGNFAMTAAQAQASENENEERERERALREARHSDCFGECPSNISKTATRPEGSAVLQPALGRVTVVAARSRGCGNRVTLKVAVISAALHIVGSSPKFSTSGSRPRERKRSTRTSAALCGHDGIRTLQLTSRHDPARCFAEDLSRFTAGFPGASAAMRARTDRWIRQ